PSRWRDSAPGLSSRVPSQTRTHPGGDFAGAVAGGHDPASQRATARNTAFNERRHNLEEKIGSVFLTCDDTPKKPLCRRNSNAGEEHLSRLFFYVRSGGIPGDASGGGTVW